MLRSIFATLIVCTFAVAASAQEPPRIELFAGYSALRVPPGANLHGGQVSVTARVWKSLWIETAFSSHGGTATDDFSNGLSFPPLLDGDSILNKRSYTDEIRDHLFAAGPRIKSGTGRVSVFGHALVGFARSSENASITAVCDQGLCEPVILRRDYTDWSPALVLGGGVDVRLTDRVSLRPIQADYVLTQFGISGNPSTQNNLRLSAGLVFRFK